MPDFILTTDSVDRYGGRILPMGVDFSAFNNNPVMLLNHGGNPIGRWENLNLSSDGRRITGTAVFDESDDRGADVARKVADGYVNACSVGVRVLAWSEAPEDMAAGQTWETVTKCELLECSIVSIPANPDAVVLTRSISPNKSEQIKLEKGVKFKEGDILHFTYPVAESTPEKQPEPVAEPEPPEPVAIEQKAAPESVTAAMPDFAAILTKTFEPVAKSIEGLQGEITALKFTLQNRTKALKEQAETIEKQGETITAQGEKIKDLAKAVAAKTGQPIKQGDNGKVGMDNTPPPTVDQLANTKKHLLGFVAKGMMSKSDMDKKIKALEESMGLN